MQEWKKTFGRGYYQRLNVKSNALNNQAIAYKKYFGITIVLIF